jgi:hypothetical protein
MMAAQKNVLGQKVSKRERRSEEKRIVRERERGMKRELKGDEVFE